MLMKLSFKYKEIPSKEKLSSIKRPIIPVMFSHDDKSITLEAIIDSGSDFILITKEVADILGLSLGKEISTVGIAGTLGKTVQSHVNLTITDDKNTERFNSVMIEVMVEGGEELEEMIMGRIPIFSEFDINFRENSNRIEFIKTKRH